MQGPGRFFATIDGAMMCANQRGRLGRAPSTAGRPAKKMGAAGIPGAGAEVAPRGRGRAAVVGAGGRRDLTGEGRGEALQRRVFIGGRRDECGRRMCESVGEAGVSTARIPSGVVRATGANDFRPWYCGPPQLAFSGVVWVGKSTSRPGAQCGAKVPRIGDDAGTH